MAALKEQDYDKYARKMKEYLRWELIIIDDFLLHTITDEREIEFAVYCSSRDDTNFRVFKRVLGMM